MSICFAQSGAGAGWQCGAVASWRGGAPPPSSRPRGGASRSPRSSTTVDHCRLYASTPRLPHRHDRYAASASVVLTLPFSRYTLLRAFPMAQCSLYSIPDQFCHQQLKISSLEYWYYLYIREKIPDVESFFNMPGGQKKFFRATPDFWSESLKLGINMNGCCW